MASAFTTRLRLENKATGESPIIWDNKTNVNFELIDK